MLTVKDLGFPSPTAEGLSWDMQDELNINDQQNHHLPASKQMFAELVVSTGCLSSCESALHTCTPHPRLNSNPAIFLCLVACEVPGRMREG